MWSVFFLFCLIAEIKQLWLHVYTTSRFSVVWFQGASVLSPAVTDFIISGHEQPLTFPLVEARCEGCGPITQEQELLRPGAERRTIASLIKWMWGQVGVAANEGCRRGKLQGKSVGSDVGVEGGLWGSAKKDPKQNVFWWRAPFCPVMASLAFFHHSQWREANGA